MKYLTLLSANLRRKKLRTILTVGSFAVALFLFGILAGVALGQMDERKIVLLRVLDVFNEAMQRDGQWVFAGGLAGPDASTVVDGRGAEPVVTDGPFIEAKEFLAGFWIVEAADLDEALALATAGSKACNRRVELRPFL